MKKIIGIEINVNDTENNINTDIRLTFDDGSTQLIDKTFKRTLDIWTDNNKNEVHVFRDGQLKD